MRGSSIFPLAIVAGIALVTSVATAHPSANKQRVTITARGTAPGFSPTGRFVLVPAQAGALKGDSGTESSFVAGERDVVRAGHRVKVVTWVTTCKGKRGTFVFRAQISDNHVGDYSVGTGTWKIVRGTGAYAGMTGGGSVANVAPPKRPWIEQREGIVAIP